MDSQPQQPDEAKTAHDNAVEAGKLLADAQLKVEKADALMQEANIRLSNARKFESVLKERQKKLDRAFVMLNKERDAIKKRQFAADQHDMLIEENTIQY